MAGASDIKVPAGSAGRSGVEGGAIVRADDPFFTGLSDELADKGYGPYACVVAWSGMEAALRRLRDDEDLRRQWAPSELMSALYDRGTRWLAWSSLGTFAFVILTFWGTNLLSPMHQP